jgi:hypothetical protein
MRSKISSHLDQKLCIIAWDDEDEPGRVLMSNLIKVTARGIADE